MANEEGTLTTPVTHHYYSDKDGTLILNCSKHGESIARPAGCNRCNEEAAKP